MGREMNQSDRRAAVRRTSYSQVMIKLSDVITGTKPPNKVVKLEKPCLLRLQSFTEKPQLHEQYCRSQIYFQPISVTSPH